MPSQTPMADEPGDRSTFAMPHHSDRSSSEVRGPRRSFGNLPFLLSSFIGREREVAEVRDLLGSRRLLTLTGSGGSGKTRLALEVLADLPVSRQDQPIYLVELAALSDPTLVPQAVASALGLHEQPGRAMSEILVESLQSRRVLLVLDNCEHLITACAELAETLLHACPRLSILATSREGLQIAGETLWVVPPLSLPALDPLPSLEHLLRRPAPPGLLTQHAGAGRRTPGRVSNSTGPTRRKPGILP